MKRNLVHALAALLFVFTLVSPALAQDTASPPPSVGAAELEKLVATLENEPDRARLVQQLKALVAAQRASGPVDEDGLIAQVSQHISRVGDDVLDTVGTLRLAPKLVDWAAAQMRDPSARGRWIEVLAVLAGVLAVGWVTEKAVGLGLSRARSERVSPKPVPVLVRVPMAALRMLIDLVPVAAFAGASYTVVMLMALSGNLRVAATMVATSYIGVRLLVVLARTLAAPSAPRIRLLAIDDETAEYLVIWTRRLAGVGVFGYFLADAARLLGLPRSGFNVVVKGLGFTIAAMLVIFILQNRAQVAASLRRAADRWAWGRRMQALTGRLADIWHALAIAYVGAVYAVWAIPVKGGIEYILRATLVTVVILVVAGVASALMKRAIDRGFAISQDSKERFPLLEARANRYLPVLHLALRSALVTVTVLALMQAWGVETFRWLTSDLGRQMVGSAISIAAVLIGATLVWEMVSGSIERYLKQTDGNGNAVERSARARTLLPLARNALMIALVVLVGLIVLSELGVNIAPLLAGAGVIGVAIGFGSQKLVQDVITGAFILFEDTIAVGDVVKLDAHSGAVEAMSIRAIRLRDLNGSVHTIPFSAVGTIVNMSREFAYAVLDVGVAYREDTDRVADVLKELGSELQADPEFGPTIVDPIEVMGVDRFDASAVVIRARFKTQPLKQWMVTREFNRRMKKRFDELGIEIPFPQTTVWLGREKAAERVLPVRPADETAAA